MTEFSLAEATHPAPVQLEATLAHQDLPAGVDLDNAGLAILTTLRNYGVHTIFGIPGTHNLEFYRHLRPLGIHPVTSRHEQGAGYAADGWSQQTGLPGVVITTSGPGLLNALSAAGTAFCESRPLILLSPGPSLGEEFSDRGELHETKDSSAAAGAVVEWSRRVSSATEAVQAIHDAFELFRYGRPRPVHIEVPLNVLEAKADCPAELLEAVAKRRARSADFDQVQTAIHALSSARNPVLLAGGGAVSVGEPLRQLVERLQIPVLTTLNGKAAIPESHTLSLGSNIRLKTAQQLCNDADVLLVVGSKVGPAELWGGVIAPKGLVIRIDRLESQLDKNIRAQVPLVGDSASVIEQLLAGLLDYQATPRNFTAERELLLREAAEFMPELARISQYIASALPAETIVAGDSSQITYFGTSTFIPQELPHSLLYTPAYATLGYGLPAAIGAKVAAPHRPVICVVGDGALMFAVQELATAVEQQLDLVVVCVDNGGYGEIKQNEADRQIDPVGVNLVQPDWAKLADSFGGKGHRVQNAEELVPMLLDAFVVGGVQLLHVPVQLFT